VGSDTLSLISDIGVMGASSDLTILSAAPPPPPPHAARVKELAISKAVGEKANDGVRLMN